MIIDNELTFSNAQAITVDAISENVYDRGAAKADIISSGGFWLVCRVAVSFLTLTSLGISLRSDSVATLDATPTTHIKELTITQANLVANRLFVIGRIDETGSNAYNGNPSERYVGVYYNVNGLDATAGKIDAYLVTGIDQSWPLYTA